ncbi:acyl carrier protein [Pseudoalteromonas fenneropenaei]|uniref:Acyl carrier protein n=1 Tax=Pseudoalteromonas fenneropenaei TaxID=1737459 RepID=A0ABV7CJU2_9GAMM
MEIEKLATLLISVKSNPDIAEKLNYESNLIEDFAIDSLDIVDILLGLEATFDISVDFDNFDFENLTKVSRLLAYIQTRKEQVGDVAFG